MSLRTLMIGSVGLNLALAGAAFQFARHSYPPSKACAIAQPPPKSITPDNSINSVSPPSTETNHFLWRILESADFDQYAANLRAVGCPEQTIRDLMLPEIQRRYTAASAAIPLEGGFWCCGPRRAAAERAQAAEREAMDAEKRALVERLFGSPCVTDAGHGTDNLTERAIMLFVLGPLPEGIPERVLATMEQADSLTSTIESRASGILLPDDEAKINGLREQSRVQLQQLLSPEQYEEFNARLAAINLRDHGLGDFQMTAEEFWGVARIFTRVYGAFDGKPFGSFFAPNPEKTEAQKAEFDQQLKTLLGEARFAEYQRKINPNLKNSTKPPF
jgi:hypothetical protein